LENREAGGGRNITSGQGAEEEEGVYLNEYLPVGKK